MLTVVWGTRPEVRKLRTLLAGARARGWPLQLLSTDQHPDLTAYLRDDPLFRGTVHLGLPNLQCLDPFAYGALLTDQLVDTIHGAVVLVQGDTATAWAGAKAAARLSLPLYHVEAGVRTGDLDDPWPEERFRRDIDQMADAGCCATPGNQLALQHEGKDVARFPVTGNPGIDALLLDQSPRTTRWPHLLVTLHRRESFGPRLDGFLRALCRWAGERPGLPVFWPVHPNPEVRAAIRRAQPLPANLVLLPPLDPRPFQQLLAHAHVVLTDSGGVQEEAAALGIPCVIARQVTDRPESVQQGLALLAPSPEDLDWTLTAASTGILKASPSPTYGDGLATPLILDHLASLYGHALR